MYSKLSIFLFLFLLSCSSSKDSKAVLLVEKPLVSPLFQDRMVLQRHRPIKVWGWTKKDSLVKVMFQGMSAEAKGNSQGKWMLTFPPQKEAKDLEMEIISYDRKLKLKEIAIGDVWICAGQSNMNFPLRNEQHFQAQKISTKGIDVREFKLSQHYSTVPLESFPKPKNEVYLNWKMNGAKLWESFSAVGYYFAHHLAESQQLAVGVINASYSDSRIESWLSEGHKLSRENPTGKAYHEPSVIDNAMIQPLNGLAVKGVLWYQGESNTRSPEEAYEYRHKLTALIQQWRRQFNEAALPFVIVQLPNYESYPLDGNVNWAILRESQQAIDLAAVYDIPTLDQGLDDELHPTDKLHISERCSAKVLEKVYNQDQAPSYPSYLHHTIKEDTLTIEFSADFYTTKEYIQGFELIHNEDNFETPAKLIKNKVIIVHPVLEKYTAVAYAWKNAPKTVSLFSAQGWPLSSFRVAL